MAPHPARCAIEHIIQTKAETEASESVSRTTRTIGENSSFGVAGLFYVLGVFPVKLRRHLSPPWERSGFVKPLLG
jgi:hypothetical protein